MDNRTKKYIFIVAALLVAMFIIRSMGPTEGVTPVWQLFMNGGSGSEEMQESDTDTSAVDTKTDSEAAAADDTADSEEAGEAYTFRTPELRLSHFTKHGIDMGFTTQEAYEEAASRVVNNPNALHKTEAEDGDDVYYIEDTNEFVVLSTDGYIRTYFNPDNGKAYFDKQ